VTVAPTADLAPRLAHLAGALRAHEIDTSLGDELDGAQALGLVDLRDGAEVRTALRIALKIPRAAFATFDHLYDVVFGGKGQIDPAPPPRPPRQAPATPRGRQLRWDPDQRRMVAAGPGAPSDGEQPGYSPEALLRRKPFDQLTARDRAAMERLLARLARRLATERSRRMVPTRGRGRPDLRASYRRALATAGEIVTLARRARAVAEPRLVFLCDTSGSMDTHGQFLLTFVLAVARAVPRAQVFAFNTELVHLSPSLAPGKLRLSLERLAAAVPDWSGGTRIGESLTAFVAGHLHRCVDARTVVVILSDGLDRGEPALLAAAARQIQHRARALIWLNPLLGDPRYQPAAAGMQAALPFVDHFAAAHDLESLERLLPHLGG
jgi:uncharacterized protein